MNEFAVSIKQPPVITGNFAEMQDELASMMQAYAGLEVTEENIPERKKDVATLRKIKEAIESKRKAAKKEYEGPFKVFESECKKLTGIIDKEIDRINADMNVYEQKRIALKRERVSEIYDNNIGDCAEYLPLESLRRKEWDNKTYTEANIASDIQESVIAVRSDLQSIENLVEADWLDECKKAYRQSGNSLVSALNRAKDLRTAKEAAEAAVRAVEHTADGNVSKEPEKPAESLRSGKKWVFTITVNKAEDAKFIRDTCEMFGFEYKEE